MDDLDDELFDNLLKTTKKKSKVSKHFDDDDDPLAGLLSDSDEKEPKGRKSHISSNQPKDDLALDTSFLPDSPPALKKSSNIFDDLLAKSEIATHKNSSKRDFILGDKYRQLEGSKESFKDVSITKQRDEPSDDFKSFGGYVPTTSSSRVVDNNRRPKTDPFATSRKDQDDVLSFIVDEKTRSNVPSERTSQGRRGISPTVDTTKLNDEIRPSTAIAQSNSGQKTRTSSDWLDLKDDNSVFQSTVQIKPSLQIVGDDSDPVKDRRSRRAVLPSQSATVESKSETDWLGTSESKQPVTDIVSGDSATTKDAEQKSGNFMDWLGTKSSKSIIGQDVPKGNGSEVQIESLLKTNQTSIAAGSNTTVTQAKLQLSSSVGNNQPKMHINDLANVTVEYESQLAFIRKQIAEMHVKFSEESLSAAADSLDLQTKVRRLEFERNQLQKSLEGLENRHKEEMDALENSFKKRSQLIEESYKRRESRLQEELESIIGDQVEKQKTWEKERSDIISRWQRKVDETTKERLEDLERMKELHRITITDIKRDHESAIERLQQIKKLEFDAMNDATSHSRTLQLVIDQLKSNTTELGNLQLRVEGGHVSGLEERELLLETKDLQLKAMYEQLTKQRDQNEQERTLLRQLITRLEEKLQKQTIVQEEEHWKLSQERNKLEMEKKMYEESKKSTSEQMERDKLQLQKSRDVFLEEQKEIMRQIYNVNSNAFVNISKDMITTEPLNTFQSLKAQSEMERAMRSIDSERKGVDEFASRLENEKQILKLQRSELETERTTINALALQVKQRSEEVEEMCLSATQTREEGYTALQEAKRLQVEFRKRQEAFVTQLESLKSKERHLAEERLSLARQRREVENLSSEIVCGKCGKTVPRETITTNNYFSPPSRIDVTDPMLMAWQVAAQKDQEFLQQENVYLMGLRTSQSIN